MNKGTSFFVLIYYALGQLILPCGDFSILPDLPKMYAHCKAMEDRDMTPFDFVTDHLVNIDGLFDAHDNGDEQKPHQPFQLQHNQFQVPYCLPVMPEASMEIRLVMPFQKRISPIYQETALPSAYLGSIFKPPIFA